MVNKRRDVLIKRNTSKNQQKEIYRFVIISFIMTSIMIILVAFLSATAYNNQQTEINLIQESLMPKTQPIIPVYLQYNISIAPNFNGGICTTTVNNVCIIREVNMRQQNVFDINITYSGKYTMDVFINPPAKVSLEMIIDYKNNQTQNELYFNNISGLTVFSGQQVPSTIKLIFSNEGNTTATGYLKINEIPK